MVTKWNYDLILFNFLLLAPLASDTYKTYKICMLYVINGNTLGNTWLFTKLILHSHDAIDLFSNEVKIVMNPILIPNLYIP